MREAIFFDLDNGMHPVGVTYGESSAEELGAAGAHWLAHEPRDILALMF